MRPWALTSQSTIIQSGSHNVRVAPPYELKSAQEIQKPDHGFVVVLSLFKMLTFYSVVYFLVVQSIARFWQDFVTVILYLFYFEISRFAYAEHQLKPAMPYQNGLP